ncbi:4322_t:CDS:2 [Diversispora eburnea]|uniref:4322_t:CDS:1 n=1 Tax=Diversispora eburnea TaxID=1213867 RepID=A0A9N9AD58_9GLOM|nr:4322_t:CDS:2 [Diversispora eburnea]
MSSKYLVFSLFFLIFVSVVSSDCVPTTYQRPVGLPQGCVCTDVYECSPTGDTCSYGYRDSRAECGALKCPPEKRRLLQETL